MPEGKTDPFLLAVFASLGRELLRSCVVANMPADQKPFAVEDRNLLELLDISKYKLKVPAYQRSYEWTEKDVTTLLKNVLETFRATAADKYLLLGSVLLRSEARNVTPALCDIVDGQQRLSTIMLLYSALYKRGQELLATEHQGSTKLTDALASLAKRFITDDDKRVLTLEFALGGSDDEDTNNVVQTWKSLTYFGNAALDATELLRQKDRYLIRWANVYEWVKQHCKHETRLVEIVQHVNERVYVSVTLVYDLRLAMRCFHDCNTTGVPLGPSDVLKVLLVSKKGTSATFPLLTVWNVCKSELIKASQALKYQHGRTAWARVLASKTVRDGLSEFRATSMDDLLNHLKAINDYRCDHQKMPYIEYMTEKYKHGEHQGLHNMPAAWASDVLQKHCNAMINLFQGRPLSRADMTAQAASVEGHDFRHIVTALLALDDPDWRPVALVALVKADASVKKKMPGIVGALNMFMLNLEHMTILFALLNTKNSKQSISWRKVQYGRIIELLETNLTGYEHFVKQLNAVVQHMWSEMPAVQQPGSAGKQQLHQGTAVQLLNITQLYIDSKDDLKNEEAAECKATSTGTDASADEQAEADAEAKANTPSDAAMEGFDEDEHTEEDETQGAADSPAKAAAAPVGVACSRPVKVGAEQPTVKNNKLARALLLILEHEQVSRGKSGAPTWNGKISVEHILPRNTSKAGAGWEQPDVSGWTATTKAAWLHRLGNLAMLNDSDNSSLGNCSFKSKVTKMKSFQASASWTIQSLLADYTDTEWCEADLQQRHQQLLDVFIKRWKVPAVPQVPSPGAHAKAGRQSIATAEAGSSTPNRSSRASKSKASKPQPGASSTNNKSNKAASGGTSANKDGSSVKAADAKSGGSATGGMLHSTAPMRQAYAVPQGKSAHSNTAKSPQSQQPVNNMLDSMNIQHEHGQQQPKQLQHQHDIQSTKQQQTHHAHAQQQQLTGTGGSLLHSAANIVSGAADAAETAAKVDSLSAGSTAQAKQVHKKRPLDIQAVAMPAEDCKKQRMTVGDALSGKEPRGNKEPGAATSKPQFEVRQTVCPCCGKLQTCRDKTNKARFAPVEVDPDGQVVVRVCQTCGGGPKRQQFGDACKGCLLGLKLPSGLCPSHVAGQVLEACTETHDNFKALYKAVNAPSVTAIGVLQGAHAMAEANSCKLSTELAKQPQTANKQLD